MNRALLYLWLTLLKQRMLYFCRSLRRPTTLLGFFGVLALVLFLFYFRGEAVVGRLLESHSLIGAALVMLCGSVFQGFLQRGLVFEPSDIEFLFTSPFTQRQLLLYRLFPSYLYAVVQSAVFYAIFCAHFRHPLVAVGCLLLFQLACFHLATAAAVYAGTISEHLHHRLRWMMLGAFFFLAAFYLRVAWDLKLAPKFLSSPLGQLLFYPAVTLPEAARAPALHYWSLRFYGTGSASLQAAWNLVLHLGGFALGAMGSLWLLLRLKGNLFEPALVLTTRRAEKRLRLQQGRAAATSQRTPVRSCGLPRFRLFRGLGAIVWKNLVVARRSKRELLLVGALALGYNSFCIALLYIFHRQSNGTAGGAPPQVALAFHLSLALFLTVLAFFLQRLLPFDFRRDGQHLLVFRTLPATPLGLALAEIAVPTAFCLALQALALSAILIHARFSWLLLLLVVLAYPAVALALNSVWNLHYLLTATKRAAGQSGSPSAVGTLLVVGLSFLVFLPAVWCAIRLAPPWGPDFDIQLPLATGLVVQYSIDFLAVLLLARIFGRFEVSRDAQ